MSESQDQTTAQNTTAQEASAQSSVQNVSPAEYDAVEMKFRYRKDDLGNQRDPIELKSVPVPNFNGLIDIINRGIEAGVDKTGKPNSKEIQLILENMYDTTRSALVSFLADNETVKDEAGVDYSKFTWTAIANQPKEDRRSNQIPEELWKKFVADYIAVMPGATGKPVEAVTNATTVYMKKFSMVKTDKKVLALLKDQLTIYTNSSGNAEEFTEILDMLKGKIDTYLKSDDVQQLVANL